MKYASRKSMPVVTSWAVVTGLGLGVSSASPGMGQETDPDRSTQSLPVRAFNQKGATARDLLLEGNEPIPDLATGVIDNRLLYNTFVQRGEKLVSDARILDDKEMLELLERAPSRIYRDIPKVAPVASDAMHERMMQASLLIGTLYDCGRCNDLHANISGGVVIAADGLAVTNYHVLARSEGKVKGMIAMNYRGECFAIAEVLAASKESDVAVVRLATDRALDPIPMAERSPKSLTPVMVLSHPHNNFYSLTTGVASRLTRATLGGDGTTWLEITAEFSGGSSGSGVFNDRGELVGLVSRIHPLFRGNKPKNAVSDPARPANPERADAFPEQILRRCVPMEAIRSLLD
jgi:serine protease Do